MNDVYRLIDSIFDSIINSTNNKKNDMADNEHLSCSSSITVEDILSIMTLAQLRVLIVKSNIQPYTRRYWRCNKRELVKKMIPLFLIREVCGEYILARVVEDYNIKLTL